MPRRRVRPEDRQRSCKACLSCKASKIRCDSLSPCAACVHRGRGDSCQYSEIDRRRRRPLSLDESYQSRPRIQVAAPGSGTHGTPSSGTPSPGPFPSVPITPDPSHHGDTTALTLPLPTGDAVPSHMAENGRNSRDRINAGLANVRTQPMLMG